MNRFQTNRFQANKTIRAALSMLLTAVIVAACTNATRDGTNGPSPSVALLRDVDLQGHRGARGLLPENTIPSFKKALDLGVRTVEIDVVVSADSHVVVSHEPWFSSEICLTPSGEAIAADEERSYNIFRMAYDSVRTFDCGSRGNRHFPEQQAIAARKPTLDSTLAALDRYAEEKGMRPPRYNIEIKSKPEFDGTYAPEPVPFARLVHRQLERSGTIDRTIVQSFDPRSLRAMKEIDDDVALALLVDNDLGFEANIEGLGFSPEVYSPNHRLVDAELIRAAHAADMLVIPWTVNDPNAMRRLLTIGVDGIITDYPDRAADVIKTQDAQR